MKTGSILVAGGFLPRELAFPEIELRIAGAEGENGVGQGAEFDRCARGFGPEVLVAATFNGPGIGKRIGRVGYHPACGRVQFCGGLGWLAKAGYEKASSG